MACNPDFGRAYEKFMAENKALGHMHPIPEKKLTEASLSAYYHSHQGIWKGSDSGKKRRVR